MKLPALSCNIPYSQILRLGGYWAPSDVGKISYEYQ
ncbi:hypothetical protein PIIN_10720 [Serendipita indica DSM 11827]|uniref:Uncharacterized protein n=1 Tax=Serendipita indica (strain DSM 11827) TaxID=1109443 RepID=G4TZI9_SERID|nr:hypothetical protein PIIN_10720 [Serendipita indica DSM 11827]